MSVRAELLGMSRSQLGDRLGAGHAIDPSAITGWEYRGISLGMPEIVDRLAWKTFLKTFHHDAERGVLRGWNVRLEQTGLDGPIEPMERRGAPIAFGHYEVRPLDEYRVPRPVREGLLLDYGRGGSPAWDPTGRVRDPVVALEAGSVERLLGWSYLDLGFVRVGTPSYFLLERLRPIERVVPAPG